MTAHLADPDPNRLGGLEWVRRTGGTLTAAERRRLIGAIAVSQAVNIAGRLKLTLGRLPEGASSIDVRDFEPPDSRLAREAEAACAEQSDLIAAHSYRTWMWGMALAALDRERLDRELFYCAALVHDWGATAPVPGEDFTIRGAERALACARAADIDPVRADLIADGICCHTTPARRSSGTVQSPTTCSMGRWSTAPACVRGTLLRTTLPRCCDAIHADPPSSAALATRSETRRAPSRADASDYSGAVG